MTEITRIAASMNRINERGRGGSKETDAGIVLRRLGVDSRRVSRAGSGFLGGAVSGVNLWFESTPRPPVSVEAK